VATLQNRIELVDGVSPALNRITQSVNATQKGFSSIANGRKVFDQLEQSVSGVERVVDSMQGKSININTKAIQNSIAPIMNIGKRIGMAYADPFIQLGTIAGRELDKVATKGQSVGRSVTASMQPLMALGKRMGLAYADPFIQLGIAAQNSAPKVVSMFESIKAKAGETAASIKQKFSDLFGHVSPGPANDALAGLTNSTNNTSGAFRKLKGLAGSTFGQMTMANLAAGAISKVAAEISSLPSKLMSASDAYSGMQARLRLIVGAGGDVEAMNEAIFQSAIRARGSYTQMADAVGKIAMTAKEAFPDPQQVVPFMEGIQKLFAIGGTGVQQQADALLQLTQALGSGKLQGDEFRSIAEAAPMIEQMVAKSLHVTTGALKQMSSDGLITAEILKKAILDNMDTINAMFEGIPLKWSDIWQIGMTKIDYAMSGVYKKVNDLANSKVVRIISDAAVNGVVALAGALDWVMNNIQYIAESPATTQFVENIISGFSEAANTAQWFVDVISQNMDYIFPILMGLGVAVMALGVAWLASSAMAVGGAIAHAVASFMETAAIIGLIFAQNGLNAALAACPLTWIIGLIVLLIVVFYVVIAAVNRFAGTSISATGIIFTVFAWLFNAISALVEFVINRFIDFANFLGSVFQDPLAAIYNLFADIWNGVVELVAEAINGIIALMNKIPGIDISSVSASGLTLERKAISGFNPMSHIKTGRIDSAGAYDAGKRFEEDPVGAMKDLFGDGIRHKLDEVPAQKNDNSGGSSGGSGGDGGAARDTADNTGRMADAMDDLIEIAKEARELASKEAVQHYTTQEIAVSVGDINPTIEKQQDIDGVIDQITEYILTGINTGAEAVHV
jgi:tape measure domain-containing protein